MGRRSKRAAVALSLLLPCIVWSGGYSGRITNALAAQKSKLTGKQLASAKVLYADNCARCHGADGRGQTAMGRAFDAPNLADAGWWKKERPSDRRLTASIRDGRNQNRMPTFGHKLSKSEIAALVRLVRTFGGK